MCIIWSFFKKELTSPESWKNKVCFVGNLLTPLPSIIIKWPHPKATRSNVMIKPLVCSELRTQDIFIQPIKWLSEYILFGITTMMCVRSHILRHAVSLSHMSSCGAFKISKNSHRSSCNLVIRNTFYRLSITLVVSQFWWVNSILKILIKQTRIENTVYNNTTSTKSERKKKIYSGPIHSTPFCPAWSGFWYFVNMGKYG